MSKDYLRAFFAALAGGNVIHAIFLETNHTIPLTFVTTTELRN